MPSLPLIHPFKRPITVLRYVPQEIVWHKAEYRGLATHLPEWDKSATLQNGCVREGRLLLRQDLLSTVEQLPTNTLLLRVLAYLDGRWHRYPLCRKLFVFGAFGPI